MACKAVGTGDLEANADNIKLCRDGAICGCNIRGVMCDKLC